MREVVSSTLAGSTIRGLNEGEFSAAFHLYNKWLDFQVFSDKNYKP